MAKSGGSGNHGEVAVVVPGGDGVLDGAQEITACSKTCSAASTNYCNDGEGQPEG
jgi:hypothetical protein